MEKGIISNKTEKGYCFIRSSTGQSIFVHINNVGKEAYEQCLPALLPGIQ